MTLSETMESKIKNMLIDTTLGNKKMAKLRSNDVIFY